MLLFRRRPAKLSSQHSGRVAAHHSRRELQCQGSDVIFWSPWAPAHTWHTQGFWSCWGNTSLGCPKLAKQWGWGGELLLEPCSRPRPRPPGSVLPVH